MNKRTLGCSGIEASAMGLGCYAIGGELFAPDGSSAAYGKVDDQESVKALHTAFDMGVDFLDTADVYGCGRSEEVVGKAIQGRRDQVVIATKFGIMFDPATKTMIGKSDIAPDFIRQACEASLARLNTDYIDLYQLHIRGIDNAEAAAHARDTLEELVAAGKIRAYGWSTEFVDEAAIFSEGENCTAIQHELNVMKGNEALLAFCEQKHLASVNRTCLGGGLLSGKFNKDTTFSKDDTRSSAFAGFFEDGKPVPEFLDKLAAIRQVLTSGGRTLVQGALCWIWAKSEITIPIPGFKTVEQVKENCGSLDFGPLSPEQMTEIEGLLGRM